MMLAELLNELNINPEVIRRVRAMEHTVKKLTDGTTKVLKKDDVRYHEIHAQLTTIAKIFRNCFEYMRSTGNSKCPPDLLMGYADLKEVFNWLKVIHDDVIESSKKTNNNSPEQEPVVPDRIDSIEETTAKLLKAVKNKVGKDDPNFEKLDIRLYKIQQIMAQCVKHVRSTGDYKCPPELLQGYGSMKDVIADLKKIYNNT